jgi:hypothetical protein
MKSKTNRDQSITIRLSEDGAGFVYTVRSGDRCVEIREVPLRPTEADEPCEDGYYGGSQAMD